MRGPGGQCGRHREGDPRHCVGDRWSGHLPAFLFYTVSVPEHHNHPGQPVMIAGRPYLVGGPAEAKARARRPACECTIECKRVLKDEATPATCRPLRCPLSPLEMHPKVPISPCGLVLLWKKWSFTDAATHLYVCYRVPKFSTTYSALSRQPSCCAPRRC